MSLQLNHIGVGMSTHKENFVRNDKDKATKGPISLFSAFCFASTGLIRVFRSQRNFKIQCAIALVAVILGFIAGISVEKWIAVTICITLVLAAECFNTALESLVDLVSPEYNRLACVAKDCAAAGVLVCSFAALVVGVIIFGGVFLDSIQA